MEAQDKEETVVVESEAAETQDEKEKDTLTKLFEDHDLNEIEDDYNNHSTWSDLAQCEIKEDPESHDHVDTQLITSKNQMRKDRKYLREVERKKMGRKEEQKRHREKYKLQRQEGGMAKDEVRKIQIQRLQDAMAGGAPRVAIDLQFEELMNNKELNHLANQLKRVYGSNKASPAPFHLQFVNLVKSGKTYQLCCEKNDGFEQYVATLQESGVADVFDPSEVIYLSPDSSNVILTLDSSKVYVIGGLVDDSVKKDTSSSFCDRLGLQTGKLPIGQFMERGQSGSFKQILTINQVFDILVKFHETKDWRTALGSNVPQKTGFVLKQENDQ